ncbi:uncharacterized protein Z519_08902 [Cladophialophora bantiana CBS 173.52]|uniref:BTB domain-containing protein n=1 Tax=Cladophialophora bantiana (strain ATCC 10958 / CBS 173.52 / CDC B-1940 / NIH 8579) TaxID=1442370 RepID=A0A0D2HAF4_CLAB1|nr:uncharacterized protein Z519_08902 [Cladophialophora bantiana CBS 173.52]KIW90258.1 hypothetical protein Z519_08902 [Cladophialophora bantiana CBS 173.52]
MDSFHPRTVKRLVQFLYTGDYDVDDDEHEATQGKLLEMTSMKLRKPPLQLPQALNATACLFEHIRVNSIGDYCRIDELVSIANTKIQHLVRSDGTSNIESRIESPPEATETVVRSTGDDELRRILASATVPNIAFLEPDHFKKLSVGTDVSTMAMQGCAQKNKDLMGKIYNLGVRLQMAESLSQDTTTAEVLKQKRCLRVLNGMAQCSW